MRRRRNDFMYETTTDPTGQDLAQARRDVSWLITAAREAIERAGPRSASGTTTSRPLTPR